MADSPELMCPTCLPKSATAETDEEKSRNEEIRDFLEKVKAGKVDDATAMLDNGLNPNVADMNGKTAVHWAMHCERPDYADEDKNMLQLLLSRGGSANYVDEWGYRPIKYGLDNDRSLTVSTILGLEGAPPYDKPCFDVMAINKRTGNSLLHDAAWYGHTKMIELLLKTKLFTKEMMNQYNLTGKVPIHIASFRGAVDFVTMLKDAGADPNLVEINAKALTKETGAEMAESMGKKDTADYLRSFKKVNNAVLASMRLANSIKTQS